MTLQKSASLLAISLAAVIQGCALTPQHLHLDPEVEFTEKPVTSDTLLGIAVVDARPSQKLGEVGDPNKEMVPVTLDEDFVPLLTEIVTEGVEKRGFSAVPESNAMNRSLVVEINSLVLNSVKTPVTFQTELKAEVSALANNAREKYERVYYVRTYQETAGPPYQKHSDSLVNQAISQALTEMFSDDKLFELLAR